MGQYYLIVNLDREEYLYPHRFGDGLKLMEFGASGEGTLLGLAALLASGNGRGSGDLDGKHPIIGSWAGQRIVVAGDYMDPGLFLPEYPPADLQAIANVVFTEGYRDASRVTLYHYAEAYFTDVSDQVIEALCATAWLRQALCQRLQGRLELRKRSDDLCLPARLRKLLQKPDDAPTRPDHVLLAEAVLRAPDDPELWQVFVDRLTDKFFAGTAGTPPA